MAPLVVIVGETGSGKSALAMELARRFDGEIICADAMTVYSGFDIGTAKPSEADRAKVPHHLLDIADPARGFSAAQFKREAERVIADISARGKLPIMVGGSGLYIDSVLYDYQFNPLPNNGERDVLNTMSLAELRTLARKRGLDTSGIDTNNPRRIMRLIETNGKQTGRSKMRPHTAAIGLRMERSILESQVKHRVDGMLAAGLEKEVEHLAKEYGWEAEAMRSVGYREWRDYFAGGTTRAETRERITRSTMQLARKQRTWFKRNNSIHWICDPSEAVEIVTTLLNK